MARAKGLVCSFIVQLIVIFVIIHVNSSRTLVTLTEDNWDQMLEGEWMVEFYAPWCPACKALQSVWEDFSNWSFNLGITVAKIDVTTSPGLSGRFMVTALPTIFHVRNGTFRQYRGGRDKASLVSFIDEKKWESIEPVPSWKSPGSFQMSVLAYFFKLSTVLRSMHNQMVDYGMPTWASYLVFAAATIMVGALLGLILVCVIDYFYPPKIARAAIVLNENEEGDEADDLIDEGAESAPTSPAETQSEEEASQTEEESQEDPNEDVDEEGKGDESTVRRRRP